jgi:membrane-associated protease RseP (regulator of RpoE activity)
MITLLLAQKIVEAARESGTVTEEELDAYLLIVLLVFFLVMVFTDPQFCFRHDIQ